MKTNETKNTNDSSEIAADVPATKEMVAKLSDSDQGMVVAVVDANIGWSFRDPSGWASA